VRVIDDSIDLIFAVLYRGLDLLKGFWETFKCDLEG